mgnify:CR=1 FL=1
MGRLRHVTGREPGLRRARQGKGFCYYDARGGRVFDAETLARIKSLAIPPAWSDVWICADPHGHLQATGTDARGRKQYRYHPVFRAGCEAAKFEALARVGQALPRVREAVDRDLRKTSLARERVLAAVVRTIELTGIRVGSEAYTRENGSFGATTLRPRHARFDGVEVHLRFRGKSGVVRSVSIDDPRVVRVLKHASGLPGETLFAWFDAERRAHRIRASDVNRYLRDAAGCRVSAKDLRTWTATVHLAEALSTAENARLGTSLKTVAMTLGHTPAVCRRSYIHPAVIEGHKAGTLRASMRRPRAVVAGLRPAEVAVLRLLSQYTPPAAAARSRARRAA